MRSRSEKERVWNREKRSAIEFDEKDPSGMTRQREHLVRVLCLLLSVGGKGALAFIAPPLSVCRQGSSSEATVRARWQCVEGRSSNGDAATRKMSSEDRGESSESEEDEGCGEESGRVVKRDAVSSLLNRLAKLSLKDYEWRSSVFKSRQADRRVEESVARMLGQDAAYVRPMDASEDKIGPLGRLERSLVQWLTLVIEEEGKRARRIASQEGRLLRPLDSADDTDTAPLSALERSAVDFLNSITNSERERVKTCTLRPKDLDSTKRGPLGDAEANLVAALDAIRTSESLRSQQSKSRGGQLVRPIDVPGPLGEMERKWVELVQAERQRAKDSATIHAGKILRPKDATILGPLGNAERRALQAFALLKQEETQRLKSIRRVLEQNRPMDRDRYSLLGMVEALLVAMVHIPQLFIDTCHQTKEFIQNKMNEKDALLLSESNNRNNRPTTNPRSTESSPSTAVSMMNNKKKNQEENSHTNNDEEYDSFS